MHLWVRVRHIEPRNEHRQLKDVVNASADSALSRLSADQPRSVCGALHIDKLSCQNAAAKKSIEYSSLGVLQRLGF